MNGYDVVVNQEIPLGILTSLLGALIFVILMARRKQAVVA